MKLPFLPLDPSGNEFMVDLISLIPVHFPFMSVTPRWMKKDMATVTMASMGEWSQLTPPWPLENWTTLKLLSDHLQVGG